LKLNCWEFHRCGREPGGEKVAEFGVCPVAECKEHHSKNGGVNGGRYCWKIAGTLCDINANGDKPKKMLKCFSCEFFGLVQDEEGSCLEG